MSSSEADGELRRAVQGLLHADLGDAAGQVSRERGVAVSQGDERAETHPASPQPGRGMRIMSASAIASGSVASLCSAIRQKPYGSER